MKSTLLMIVIGACLFAADAPKPAPQKHLTAEQQRDLYQLVAAANEAQVALLNTPESTKAKAAADAVNAKARELFVFCGGQVQLDSNGRYDCPAPPAPPQPKPAK